MDLGTLVRKKPLHQKKTCKVFYVRANQKYNQKSTTWIVHAMESILEEWEKQVWIRSLEHRQDMMKGDRSPCGPTRRTSK